MTETLAPVKPGRLILNGEAVDSASGRTFTTWNPATEQAICEVAEAGVEDADRAVKAARAAFDSGPWPRMKPVDRQRILWKLGDLILEHADEIAEGRLTHVLGCDHQGRPLLGEVLEVVPELLPQDRVDPRGRLV